MIRPAGRVIVIGAGIVGIACAIHLQRKGLAVTVIDRLAPGEGTSFGNAGVLAAGSVIPVPVPGLLAKVPKMLVDPDSPLFLRWRYLPRLAPWLIPYLRNASVARVRRIAQSLAPIVNDTADQHRDLARGTPAERWLTGADFLFVFRDRRVVEAAPFIWDLKRSLAPPASELGPDDLRDAVPGLNPSYRYALGFTGHGSVTSPSAYVKDLAAHFGGAGGTVLRAEVGAVSAPPEGPVEVTAGGAVHTADRLVVAAGAFSGRIARMIGDHFPLEAERGYHVELAEPSLAPPMPVMVSDAKMVATPMANGLRFAGLVEFGGLDAGPSRAPVRLLLNRAREVFPGLTWSRHTEWMGHRPATPDSLPVIGARAGRPSVVYAFGHQHVGLTGGPKTGRIVAAMIAGEPLNLDTTPYSPDRSYG